MLFINCHISFQQLDKRTGKHNRDMAMISNLEYDLGRENQNVKKKSVVLVLRMDCLYIYTNRCVVLLFVTIVLYLK